MEKNKELGKKLVYDELFDLILYKKLITFTQGDLLVILKRLIPVEQNHLKFWKEFFHIDITTLSIGRKIKLNIILLFCRIFGHAGTHLVLESIEIYGIKKYLRVWEQYKDDTFREGVRKVLEDEFQHEHDIISSVQYQKINPARIRDIFLGLNDGLIEILGAVAGFFAAFQHASSVLIAGFTVAIAGSISMAAGAFIAASSQKEVELTNEKKRAFLGEDKGTKIITYPIRSAFFVGVSYLVGSLVPISPVLFGAKSIFLSIIIAGIIMVIVSYILAFLSGMDIKKRIALNLSIMLSAVFITYIIGTIARILWEVEI